MHPMLPRLGCILFNNERLLAANSGFTLRHRNKRIALVCCPLNGHKPTQLGIETMSTWTIDVANETARHSSGLIIKFEGTPNSDDFGGTPIDIPASLNPLQMASLLRTGFEEYSANYASARRKQRSNDRVSTRPILKLKKQG